MKSLFLQELFLSVLYSGKVKIAPGTIGSACSVLLGLPILAFSAETLVLLACLIGIIAVREINTWERANNTHDASWIVIDELVGVWIAMAMVGYSIVGVMLAFISFRVFDIWKPSIIGRIDREVKGGLGVVADDVLAGLCAGICSLAVLELSAYYGLELRTLI